MPAPTSDTILNEIFAIDLASQYFHAGNVSSTLPSEEIQALYYLYMFTGGDDWSWHTHNSSSSIWMFDGGYVDPCGDLWEGLTCICDQNNYCNVMALELSNYNLIGNIPDIFSAFLELEALDLSSNSFLFGWIPESISQLSKLEFLMLNNNYFSGTIPSTLGNVTTKLRVLDLSSNLMIVGNIPDYLVNCVNLELLMLNSMSLSGRIPHTIGNLILLRELRLSNNLLTGFIPSSITKLTLLPALAFDYNSLTGPIPTEIGHMKSLTSVSLSSNRFSGTAIPRSIANLTNLVYYDVSGNKLSELDEKTLGGLTDLMVN